MAVILTVERKTAKARIFLALVYAVLSLGGLTMVWPFLVMLAASLTGPYDYYRYSPVVRAFWDRSDRFMRYVAACYPRFPAEVFPEAPAHWGSWIVVARDREGGRRFADRHLAGLDDPASAVRWTRMAADYAAFNRAYDLRNSACAFDPRDVAGFVREHFEAKLRAEDPQGFAKLAPAARRRAALARLNAEWPVRYPSFFGIRMIAQQRAPLHHAGWDYPSDDPKMELYQELKRLYRVRAYGTDDGGGSAPAAYFSRTVPYESRPLWLAWLRRSDAQARLGLPPGGGFTADDYTRLAGRACAGFEQLPFPLPDDAPAPLRAEWDRFVRTAYPRRLLRVRVTPELDEAYRRYVAGICRTPAAYTRLTGQALPDAVRGFAGLRLPPYENSTLWRNFIPQVPLAQLEILSAEQAWQAFLRARYGTVQAVNAAYGWQLAALD